MPAKVKPNLDWLLDVDLTPEIKKRRAGKPQRIPKTIVADTSLFGDPDFTVADDGNAAILFGDKQIRCTLDNGMLKVVYADLQRSVKENCDNGKCKADGYLLCNTTGGIHSLKTISVSRAIKCAKRFPDNSGKALAEFLDKKYLRKFLGHLPNSPGISLQWIPGFIDYAAGDDGSIWSRAKGEWTRLKINDKKHGYFRLLIKKKYVYVHTLVLLAFRGKPEEGQECRHLNDNKEDNRLANLTWGTPTENQDDRRRNDPRFYDPTLYQRKLNSAKVMQMRSDYESGRPVIQLAREFGVCPKTVRDVIHKRIWKYVSQESA